MLKLRYLCSRLGHLEPDEPFDIGKHQLISARSLMIRNLDRIARHPSEIRGLRGREVALESGERYETDLVLWATGYRMNLEYLDLPEFSGIRTAHDLHPRLGSLVRSIDYPDMFFVGMSLIESTSSTPFFAAVEAKSIVAHIEGRCEVPTRNVPHHVAHRDLFRHFATFDRANYPGFWWRIKYFALAVWYLLLRNRSVRV